MCAVHVGGIDGEVPTEGKDAAMFRVCPNSDAFSPSAPSKLSDLATEGDADDGSRQAEVWLHVYDLDPYTGWANSAFMRGFELGVYHCGVEVYDDEWSFQYFEDSWDDPTLSGVMRTTPKLMEGYKYRESVQMGVTPLRKIEVKDTIRSLMCEWTAATYHITHRNCVSFAEILVAKLQTKSEFPPWIKALCEVSNQSRAVNFVVDSVWGWSQWYMKMQYLREKRKALQAQASSQSVSWWDMLRCSGNHRAASCEEEIPFENARTDDDVQVMYHREGYSIIEEPIEGPFTARNAPAFDLDKIKGKRPPFQGDAGIDEPL